MKHYRTMGLGTMSVGVATALAMATAGTAAASPAILPSWQIIKTSRLLMWGRCSSLWMVTTSWWPTRSPQR